MMRWLKDKKRERRSGSLGGEDDGNDDDYGFEQKDKSASNKSPVTKRQLPPTPLTPEERSPHIYEEIRDLSVLSSSFENAAKASSSPQKHKKHKHYLFGSATSNGASSVASSSTTASKNNGKGAAPSSKDDSISPYMVVPVDEDVRQTPTDFHRNGTPEVHCDVIVKDTHCEILLSRKPKISAFRMDSGNFNVGGESNSHSIASNNTAIRNNTHFCSQNRRASVDAHGIGSRYGSSSSGPWSSSAFSSSSTSRVNSVGTSMSLSTLSERHTAQDDNGSSSSSAKGVMTYMGASSFIPRATKLVFNPLKPLDGDDTSLSNQDPFFSMMPPPPSDTSFSESTSVPIACSSTSKLKPPESPVTYSSIPTTVPNPNPNPNTNPSNFQSPCSSQAHSRAHPDSNLTNASRPNFNDPHNPSHNPVVPGFSTDEKQFHSSIMRAASPSNASTCTYTSVTFPTEPKVYNTIAPDLISQETTRELQSHTAGIHLESSIEVESETESVRYSSIQETALFHKADPGNPSGALPGSYSLEDSVYSGVLSYRVKPNSNTSGFSNKSSRHTFSNNSQNLHCVSVNMNKPVLNSQQLGFTASCDHDTSSIVYSGIVDNTHCGEVNNSNSNNNNNNNINNDNTVYSCIETSPDIDDQHNLQDNVNNSNSNSNTNNTNNSSSSGNINMNTNATTSTMVKTSINIDTSEADVDRILYGQATNHLMLEFCTCSDDQHSTGCGGYLDPKHDDDTSSIATTINEPRGPCTGCGRLIRQITYSESYSDETYEHVYSSRLLLRRGRRYSSPDITMSEISNSETNLGIDNSTKHQHENNIHLMSRDDTWTTKAHDVMNPSTFYRPKECSRDVGDTKNVTDLFPSENGLGGERKGSHLSPHQALSGVSRQSFSAYGASPKRQGFAPDKNTSAACLAVHRASLPPTIPSNLVPVTDDLTATSTALAQLQPKSSAFSNLFSKFSRPKSKHNNNNNNNNSSKTENIVENTKSHQQKHDDMNSNPITNPSQPCSSSSSTGDQIPERNTSKLSKLFQRLSTNDSQGGTDGAKVKDRKRDEDEKIIKILKVDIPESASTIPKTSLLCPEDAAGGEVEQANADGYLEHQHHHQHNKELLSPKSGKFIPCSSVSSITKEMDDSCIDLLDRNRPSNRGVSTSSVISVSQPISISSTDNTISGKGKTALLSAFEPAAPNYILEQNSATSNPKHQNKADSGDTCYEYDISTSSESEHNNYDHFLSKVKKSLNLEREVQQIADMNAQRRRAFCKKCKRSDTYSTAESEDGESLGGDLGSSHLTAKFGDLRKIFGDFVVDQRAAILDCLTDYAHGPFNVKGDGRESSTLCRGCGCEIMTSDSESMTTVYSILSQQFRMTSPGTHTPSCDSDEGTMADNSCESADEEDNDVSSGYDEAIGPLHEHPTHHKIKKKDKCREKKEKKHHHFGNNIAYKEQEKSKRKPTPHTNHSCKRDFCNHSEKYYSARVEDRAAKKHQILLEDIETLHSNDKNSSNAFQSRKSSPTLQNQKNRSKRETRSTEQVSDYVFNNATASRKSKQKTGERRSPDEICTKPRPRPLATEKVIQDIYAPLPSKARSWLTARNCEATPLSGAACSCGVLSQQQPQPSKPIQHYEDIDNGNGIPPTALLDCAGARMIYGTSGLSGDCHNNDSNPNSVQSHHDYCQTLEKNDSTAPRTKEEPNKKTQLRSGHLNSEKSPCVKEAVKLEYNSACSRREFPSSEKVGSIAELSTSRSKDFLLNDNNDNGTSYSKRVIENMCTESKLLPPDVSSNSSARMVGERMAGERMVGERIAVETKHVVVVGAVQHDAVRLDDVKAQTSAPPTAGCLSLGLAAGGCQVKRQDLAMSRQKQKQLQMAALDFLPETALGSDDVDITMNESTKSEPEVKSAISPPCQRTKSKMVERLAKMFEDNSSNSSPISKDCKKISITGTDNNNISNDNNSNTISISFIGVAAATATPTQTNNNNNDNSPSQSHPAAYTDIANTTCTEDHTSKLNTLVSATPTTTTTHCKEQQSLGVTKFTNTINSNSYNNSNSNSNKNSSSGRPYINVASSSTPLPPLSAGTTESTPGPSSSSSSTMSVNQGQSNGNRSHAAACYIVKDSRLPPTPTPTPTPTHTAIPIPVPDHPVSPPHSHDRSLPDKSTHHDKGKSQALNINTSDTSPKLPGPFKTAARSKTDKRTDSKHEICEVKGTGTSTSKDSGRKGGERRNSESRSRKLIVSPSPSSSSGSSAAKRKGHGHTRQKKLSKRSHHNKRARSKSEGRRSHHERKEERTRYYFSSDLSDIDVIEVEDWETYSSARSRENNNSSSNNRNNGNNNSGGKSISSRDRSCRTSTSTGQSQTHQKRSRTDKGDKKLSKTGDRSLQQGQEEECSAMEEILYSIPPNSSEIRGTSAAATAAASRADGGTSSPQLSPDVSKFKKSKKTDIYKTRKCNNQLLSDLIIRNYDRQMYDVCNNTSINNNTNNNNNNNNDKINSSSSSIA